MEERALALVMPVARRAGPQIRGAVTRRGRYS
uniref:Uncharacterized protein n=1 Tax=Arundo donax TaxID=35708 RepID=A0A0A9H8T6_ARUDO